MHFNRVIENVHRVGAPLGKFHGSENHGVVLPPGQCSLRPTLLLPRPPRGMCSHTVTIPLAFDPSFSLSLSLCFYFSLSKIMQHPGAVCLHTNRTRITRFCRRYRSPGRKWSLLEAPSGSSGLPSCGRVRDKYVSGIGCFGIDCLLGKRSRCCSNRPVINAGRFFSNFREQRIARRITLVVKTSTV